jgi:hypothetical protein
MALGKKVAKKVGKAIGGGSGKLEKKKRPGKKLTKSDMFKQGILNKLSNDELMKELIRLKLVPSSFKRGGVVKKGK